MHLSVSNTIWSSVLYVSLSDMPNFGWEKCPTYHLMDANHQIYIKLGSYRVNVILHIDNKILLQNKSGQVEAVGKPLNPSSNNHPNPPAKIQETKIQKRQIDIGVNKQKKERGKDTTVSKR